VERSGNDSSSKRKKVVTVMEEKMKEKPLAAELQSLINMGKKPSSKMKGRSVSIRGEKLQQ